MNFSRRGLLSRAWALPIAASPLLVAAGAMANDTAQYVYDPLGRLVRVTLSDGTIVFYKYDAAGNRTQVIRSDGSPFIQTVQVTGSSPINLRTVADAAGYTGLTSATITFQVASAVTIVGAPGIGGGPAAGIGIDTGLWPSSTYAIALTLEVTGKVYGGGGGGGGENGSGSMGGDAIYCRENIAITVNSAGQVKAGGGGGGAGGGWSTSSKDPETGQWGPYEYSGGGGGGGGFPNGPGGWSNGVGGMGAVGTTSGGGVGGSGGGGARTWGAGGAGGAAATGGATGASSTGTGGCSAWACYQGPYAGGSGGPPGYAIRKNGKTVSVTNNGTIAGTQG